MMYTTYANGGIIMAYQCIVVLTERLCQIVVLTGFLLVVRRDETHKVKRRHDGPTAL